MNPIAKMILGAAFVTVALIYWADWRAYRRSTKTDEHIKGVRVRLERHADESAFEAEKDRFENKKLRASIYRQFKEWLQHMRAP